MYKQDHAHLLHNERKQTVISFLHPEEKSVGKFSWNMKFSGDDHFPFVPLTATLLNCNPWTKNFLIMLPRSIFKEQG